MKKLQSIQSLRGAAALMVVVHHASGRHFLPGAAGVDLFFIISGFIMGTVGTTELASDFFLRRIKRVVPLYWLITIIMCVSALAGVFRNFYFDTSTLLKSLFFIPYFDKDHHIWPLVVQGWTLNYEMFFYGIFTIGLLSGRPILLTLITMTICGLAGLVFHFETAIMQTWFSPLGLEFCAGLLISRMNLIFDAWVGLLAICFGVFLIIIFQHVDVFDNRDRVLHWGLGSAFVVAGSLIVDFQKKWPDLLRPLALLGDASYSLYLLHGLVLATGNRILGENQTVRVMMILLSVALAFCSLHFFERPMARLKIGTKKEA